MIACMQTFKLDVPVSFNALFLRLRCIDLARYCNIDGVVETANAIVDLGVADEEQGQQVQLFAIEVISDCLVVFANALGSKATDRRSKFSSFVDKLLSSATAEGINDLRTVAAALSTSIPHAEQKAAMDAIHDKTAMSTLAS